MEYRRSHLAKGGTYDRDLESDPFDAYIAAWERRYLEELLPRLFPGPAPRYLDFACGTGRITKVVAPFAASTVGVDISESMLNEARTKLPSATFVEADLTRDARDLGPFDLITAFRFFGNADPVLRSGALTAMNRLQPVGACLIVNNHRNPNSLASLLLRALGKGESTELLARESMRADLTHGAIGALLESHGYSIETARPIAVWQVAARLTHSAGSRPVLEETLERIFGAEVLCHVAPDALLVARKVRDLQT